MTNEKEQPKSEAGIRLNKFIAHCGVCSRREAGNLVKAGKVTVNGAILLTPWYLVQEEDRVEYKGKVLQKQEKKIYVLLNKPKNTITSLKDEKGRKTVYDIVKNHVEERIYPVGRLDRNTLGLLLLTNDGDLAQKLAHPSHKIQKYYQVTLDREVLPEHLEQIKKGLELEDGLAPVDAAHYLNDNQKEVGIKIHIGRNRIVRRLFEHFGYSVKRLDRTYYASLTKKDLPRGKFRHLTKQEVIRLKHFI
ncbi:MAG: pseudouridine synthase [Bacteroidota bacterium]